MAKKQGYIYHFFFLAKIVTTKIWLSGVLDYSNKNWTITPLSHISLMLQYNFFFTSINYNEEKNKSFTEENNQSTKKVWLRCMSDHEWHDITRYNLVMLQKSMIKLYNIKSISHHCIPFSPRRLRFSFPARFPQINQLYSFISRHLLLISFTGLGSSFSISQCILFSPNFI